MWYVCDVLYVCVSCFVVCGCAVSRRYINDCNCDMFSGVNMYLDHMKLCVSMVKGMSVVVNVRLSLMSVISPCPPCTTYRHPISLNFRRSSMVHGCVKREHCNICDMFYVSGAHTHIVSPLK